MGPVKKLNCLNDVWYFFVLVTSYREIKVKSLNCLNNLIYTTTELERKAKCLIIKLGLFYGKFYGSKKFNHCIYQIKINQLRFNQPRIYTTRSSNQDSSIIIHIT